MTTDLDRWVGERENVFGILEGPLTTEEKIGKLLAFLPMAFQVVEEARDTIARLRTELEEKEKQECTYLVMSD